MRGTRVAVLAAFSVIATGTTWISTVSAIAGEPIVYNGRATAATVTTAGITTTLADSGELPSAGGSVDGSALSGTGGGLTSDTLHASAIGQGDRTRSEASATSALLTSGLLSVGADLAMSRASAVKHGNTVTVSGTSHVTGLTVNGVPVVVTGQPNQTIPVPDGQLVVNEQSTTNGGTMKAITVTAVHLTTSTVDAILGRSRSGVSVGQQNCAGTKDHATGGGWLTPTVTERRTFGFVGGINGNAVVRGHLLFINHATDESLRGQVNAYVDLGTTKVMTGEGESEGEPATFELNVTDNGEPGTADTFQLSYQTPTRTENEGGTLGGGNIQAHPLCG